MRAGWPGSEPGPGGRGGTMTAEREAPGGSRARTGLRGPDWQQIPNQEELSIHTAPAEIRRDDDGSALGLGEEIGGGGKAFSAEMKFEPQSGREVEVGGTALSAWLLPLFSTQLKGECSLIWTRGEEKRSGTGIWQEGTGKRRESRRGESGHRIAQGGVCRRGGSRAGTRRYCSLASGGVNPRTPPTHTSETRRAGVAGAEGFWEQVFPADCRLGSGKG